METQLFKSLKYEGSLSDRVTKQIQNLIAEEKLSPGDRLPPERELTSQLGVSRTVVREAIKALKAKGLIEVRRGSGVVVTSISPELLSESISFYLQLEAESLEHRHIMELRMMLEIEIAGMATKAATESDLASMEKEIQHMEALRDRILDDPQAREEFARADVGFHLALAKATHNPLLPVLFSPIIDFLIKQRLDAIDQPGALEQGMLYHKDILEAIQHRDEEGARKAMREHLEKSVAIMEMVDRRR